MLEISESHQSQTTKYLLITSSEKYLCLLFPSIPGSGVAYMEFRSAQISLFAAQWTHILFGTSEYYRALIPMLMIMMISIRLMMKIMISIVIIGIIIVIVIVVCIIMFIIIIISTIVVVIIILIITDMMVVMMVMAILILITYYCY